MFLGCLFLALSHLQRAVAYKRSIYKVAQRLSTSPKPVYQNTSSVRQPKSVASTRSRSGRLQKTLCAFHLRILLVEARNRLNAFIEVPDAEVLVGAVQSIGIKTEAHQDGLYAEHFLEGGDNWDGTT